MNPFSLSTALAITGGISLLIGVFLWIISYGQASRSTAHSYRFLSLGYAALGLRAACQLLNLLGICRDEHAGNLFYIIFISFIWLGVRSYVRPRPVRRSLVAVPILLVGWDFLAHGLGLPMPWPPLPQHFTGGVVFALSGLHLWRIHRDRGSKDLFALAVLLWLQGLSTLSYPFTRMTGYAPYGFTILSFLASATGMGLMVAALREEQRELLREMAAHRESEKQRERSLAFVEALLAHSPTGISVFEGASGRCIHANQTLARMVGGTREGLLAQNFRTLASWREHGLDRIAEATLADGTTRNAAFYSVSMFGQAFAMECFLGRFHSENIAYLLFVAMDVTERKRAEDSLRETNRRLELATTTGSLGIWELNLADGVQVWNDQMYQIYGLAPQASHPDHAYWRQHIVHPDDLQAAEAAIQEALAGRRPYDLQFRIVRPDGSVRHIQSDARILRDADGTITRAVGINRDRTREVVAEAEQRRLQLELQHTEKLDSLGSLAGGVAHDMNNVLAAIMGMASVMRASSPDGDPRSTPLDTIIRACSRGRDVIKSLLYFARKGLEHSGPVNLNGIAREMVQLLSYTTLKRIQIITDYQEPLGLIEGDSGALSHALVNLCVNAVDAMPDGGSLTIRTRQREDRTVEISIRDSGQGMTPEVIRKAVEPFYTTKPVGKGTGLGLAMVYGTVKAHNGTMDIQSAPGQGTEVVLAFPPLPGCLEPAVPAGAAASPAQEPMGVLLVDDDELIRLSVGPMLTLLGHRVETAESGQEALDRFHAGLEADLVILDMNMPGLNGAQTLARLLAIRPRQTVLLATGHSDEAIAPLLRDHPNVHSLRKPFSMDELRRKLQAIPAPVEGPWLNPS